MGARQQHTGLINTSPLIAPPTAAADVTGAPSQPPPGVVWVDTADALSAIHTPWVAAAIWKRQPPPDFQNWIDRLDHSALPKARVIMRPQALPETVKQVCDGAGTPDCAQRDHLIDDISTLAGQFAHLMGASWLRLRLDVVTNNACRKFHIDALRARLVCTYRGPGTQYATDGDHEQIQAVPTGAAVVLRGTAWPEQPRSSLLHRSPPIEGSGQARLVLVVDPITDPAMEI